MNLPDTRTLPDYHYWARDRLLEALDPLTPDQFNRNLGSSFTSIRETVVHLYAAEGIWYARWNGQSPTALTTSDGFPDVASVRRAWTDHETKMRAFVESLGESGLTRVFDTRGERLEAGGLG